MATRKAQDNRTIDGDALMQRVVALCHERKAEDVVSLDCRGLVEYMDHLVICTGRSARQTRAIAEHVITQLKREEGVLPLSRAGLDAGSWVCVDLVDVVLHVFEPETRAHYDLELLWADAQHTAYESPRPAAGEVIDVDETDVDETDVDETDVDETDVDETDADVIEEDSIEETPAGETPA